MNWQEKIAVTQELRDTVDSLGIYFRLTKGASSRFLKSMRERFPFVDPEYLSFLELSNGGCFDHCVLFGSGESSEPQFPSIIDDLEGMCDEFGIPEWRKLATSNSLIPIGRDSGCSRFLMMPNREIVLVDVIRQLPSDGHVIAISFSELLSDVFMGNRFDDLFFPGTMSPDGENAWTQFLRRQGWRP